MKKNISDAWLCLEQAGAPTYPPASPPTERYFFLVAPKFFSQQFCFKNQFSWQNPFLLMWQVSCGVLIQPSLSTVVEAAGEDLYEVHCKKGEPFSRP
jgi:hypothetical protein